MARHKVKRFAAGDPVVDDGGDGYGIDAQPMSGGDPMAAQNAMDQQNQAMGAAYSNMGSAPAAPTDIGPQAPIQQDSTPMPAQAPKRVIVTKKQLADSGYDNLRDYLNAQKGVPRKGEAEPRKPTKAAAKTAPAKETAKTSSKKTSEWEDNTPVPRMKGEWEDNSPLPTMKKSARDLINESKPSPEKTQQMLDAMVPGGGALKMVANAAKNLAARRGAVELAKEVAPALKRLETNGRRVIGPAQTELANPQLKLGMKKGGHVKKEMAKAKAGRGDGIATKGYTKGKYL